MIRIDRHKMPNPISDEDRHQVGAEMHNWEQDPDQYTRRNSFAGLRSRINRRVREPLLQLFEYKCAFCESDVGATSSAVVERFRPIAYASDLAGESSPQHYSWLLAEWDNLYIACSACSRAKRTLFPVDGPRGPVMSKINELRAYEDALLIDPCFDEPSEHIVFSQDGSARFLTRKGEATIGVFNLNRDQLVRARRSIWTRAEELHQQNLDAGWLTGDSRTYAAVARQALAMLSADPTSLDRANRSRWHGREDRSADEILAADEEAYRLTARTVRRVEIRNFKALRHLDVEFKEPDSERSPWLVLLGENSTGKSTLLQAVALTLAGANEANRLIRPLHVLSVGERNGFVRVWFWDNDEPVELVFDRSKDRFVGTERPSAIVLGYGALRYAERKRQRSDPAPRFTRIKALMDPIARVRYSGSWFAQLDHKRFLVAQDVLQQVLPRSRTTILVRTRTRVIFNVGGHSGPLSELSAGYQTVIGMCADIMRLLFERWDSLASATGIVLIDEIDAHLHPSWTMRIVGAFRGAFPQVQFIASTHDPLALRGLHNNEVALLRRDADDPERIVIDQSLPPIEGMQVDELLTSRIFGLDSTIDPASEALLNEYYDLLSRPGTPGVAKRIKEIRQLTGDREALGRNVRERLMLEESAKFLKDTEDDPNLRVAISDGTRNRVREIIRFGLGGRAPS
ncbi:AAA family ATPase [Sphingomonas sp. 4RDLI-65]|uniref:AAA family ATPase n=1 Tax=Sphingomonas sp. 4RDLI-65 TaxID=3111641 RepID=UPI003C24B55E